MENLYNEWIKKVSDSRLKEIATYDVNLTSFKVLPIVKPSMRKLAFFDFDGTLYPFRPYDSEDLLFCMAAETEEEKAFAEKLRIQDEQGNLTLSEFRKGELKLITGKDISYVDKTAKYISDKAGKDFLKPLKRLKESGFELYIVSCGISDIAERYLKLQGVRDLFSDIYSKDLIIKDNKIIGLDCSVMSWSDDKKKIILKILSEIKEKTFSVSVGDGLTDIPMFTATDKALFIDLGQNPFASVPNIKKENYPVTKSIDEMVSYILS